MNISRRLLTGSILTCLGFLAFPLAAVAEVQMPTIFGDHMVIQRQAPLPVWGTADPGEHVIVTLEGEDTTRTAEATAGEDGRWTIELDAVEEEGPYRLAIDGGESDAIEFEDVLAGEVWLCSGQSNMEWHVQHSANAEEEIANADFPKIRIFHVARATEADPASDVVGEWKLVTPESIPSFSAVGYYFGRRIHDETKLPVGLINSSWGGTPIVAWMPPAPIQKAGHSAALELVGHAVEEREAATQPAALSPGVPTVLYNGMIAPLTPYAVRGFLWYQGESDAARGRGYAPLLRELIASWRDDFAGPADSLQPFLIVQLANFHPRSENPAGNDDWARLRDAQREVAAEEGNGLAVTIDIGDAVDIHPRNKQEVGARLARVALRNVYGQQDLQDRGPTAASATAREGRVVVQFDHADGLVLWGGDWDHAFAVGDADGNFVWATPSVEGDSVILRYEGIESPAVVRYAWQINPPAPLYNGAGLPAVPFELQVGR